MGGAGGGASVLPSERSGVQMGIRSSVSTERNLKSIQGRRRARSRTREEGADGYLSGTPLAEGQ